MWIFMIYDCPVCGWTRENSNPNRKFLSNIIRLESQKLKYHITLETSRKTGKTQKFETKIKDKVKQSNQLYNSSLVLVPINLTSRNLAPKNDYNVIHKFVNLARFLIISKIHNLNLGINQFISRIRKNFSKEDTTNSQYSNSLYFSKNCKYLIHSDSKIYLAMIQNFHKKKGSPNNSAHSVQL